MPIVEFDRGDGGQPARKVLTQGVYLVGVDSQTQRFDLFDSASQPPSSETDLEAASGESSTVTPKRRPPSTQQEKQQRIADLLERLKG